MASENRAPGRDKAVHVQARVAQGSAVAADWEEFGRALAVWRARAKLSRKELAAKAGVSVSTLSRLERGARDGMSRSLVGRLVESLGADPAALYSAAGFLPEELERKLADPRWLGALVGDSRARSLKLLRRIYLQLVAKDVYQQAGSEEAQRPDLRRLLGQVRLTATVLLGPGPAVQFADAQHVELSLARTELQGEAGLPLQRFLTAHAIGHAVLGVHECCYPAFADAEDDATTIACFLLAPPGLLEHALQSARPDRDLWKSAATDLPQAVASSLGIPLWVAVRRLGEEGSLEAFAEENYAGEENP